MNVIIEWNKIEHNGKKKATCPNCSRQRQNKTDRCLSINHDKGLAFCHHCNACSFRENIMQETEKYFKIPIQTWKNYTDLSDTLTKHVEARKISQSTVKALKWTEEKYYQPVLKKEVNNIVFNSFEGNVLVNKKYRSSCKTFTQSPGTKSIFYNINAVIGSDEVVIVEGEFDVAAFYEIGVKNVISVPNGANDNDEYWKNSEKYLKDVKQFIIAVDNDEKGHVLKDKIAQRLGRWKCRYIDFIGKDANDDLISGCLQESYNGSKIFPVNGTFTAENLKNACLELYRNGLPKTLAPKSNDFGNLKNVFSVMRGQLTVVTGMPSSGKSNFNDWYVLNLVKDYDMKASWFSPEHAPLELYQSNFIEKVIGKNYWKAKNGVGRITEEDIKTYNKWANERIYFTDCVNGNFPTWDWLFDTFKEQMYTYGIDVFVIDAFNKLILPKGNQLEQINKVLTKLTSFARANNVLIFLVAHPTKMRKNDSGLYDVPTLYDVSGSADFKNQTHNGYTIYRYFEDLENEIQNQTVFINMKTKFNFQGKINDEVYFKYNDVNGRFHVSYLKPNNESLINLEGGVISNEKAEIFMLNESEKESEILF